ncbi:lysoplasmalogenase [Mycolicibacterium poriferae]|uniref:lysoplasmalogenase n=1 Tax=Mycolicibacterium poriferae TaxID=39694 RepID=UPI0024BAE8AC|nr:lysoplasmalogenase [Mycolicibacterium poriferae]
MTQARRRREPTVPVGSSRARTLWFGAALVAVGYGVFLIVVATRVPSGTDLTGQFALQPAVKALTAVVLAAAAVGHPVVRERRWLIGALLFSAAGDYLLAMPWWEASFVLGLAAFLIAHLCFLAALVPLAAPTPTRLAAAGLTVASCVALLIWFWPRLIAEGMAVPVTLYIAVLGAMVCAALLADLPTPWTALGAVSFAGSDAMIGISRFVLGDERLAVPIWWFYAASLLLLTAGLLFGRSFGSPSGASATPAG